MYERHKCSMCTHSKAAISVQDNANTMEILSNKNKINALFIVFPTFRGPCHLNASIGKQTPALVFIFNLPFLSLYLVISFSVSVSSFTACQSPVYSSPVSFSVSSSKFSSASCCSLIHFKGANYIFSNFCVL